MGYGYATTDIQRTRSLAGIIVTNSARITGPDLIAGSAVTVTWDNNNAIADTYRVTIGTASGLTDVADSGDLIDVLSHTFTQLAYTTTTAYITLYYRLGAGEYRAVEKIVPIDYVDPTPVDNDPDKNWDDSTTWDDSVAWTE